MMSLIIIVMIKKECFKNGCFKKVPMFYTAQYPVRWTAQRAFHSGTNSTSLGNILATQQLRAKSILIYTVE